ncbi:MAG: hypothetical protein WC498_02525 [Candidatus Saccharimonadales bacterium]
MTEKWRRPSRDELDARWAAMLKQRIPRVLKRVEEHKFGRKDAIVGAGLLGAAAVTAAIAHNVNKNHKIKRRIAEATEEKDKKDTRAAVYQPFTRIDGKGGRLVVSDKPAQFMPRSAGIVFPDGSAIGVPRGSHAATWIERHAQESGLAMFLTSSKGKTTHMNPKTPGDAYTEVVTEGLTAAELTLRELLADLPLEAEEWHLPESSPEA